MKKLAIAVLMCGLFTPVAAAADASDLLKALKSDDQSARLAAIDALAVQGAKIEGAVPALIEQLADQSALVRAHAAQALGQIGPAAKPATEAIIKLVGDEDKLVRREAVQALGNIRPGPEVAIPLFTKMLSEAQPEVRLHAMHALAEAGKQVVPPMIKALEHEEARYWACLVLAEVGPDAEAAVPALVKVITTDKRPEFRREAIITLSAIGPGAAAAVPVLSEIIGKVDDVNVGPAVFALGAIGAKAKPAQDNLKKLYKGAPDKPFLKTVILWTLARMNPDNKELVRKVVPHLVKGLQSENPRIRAAAAQALIDLDPDPEITRPLMKDLMEKASPEVIDNIIDVLARLGEKAVPRMIRALQYPDARAKVAAILARIGPPAKAAVPALIEALADKDPNTRVEILFALAAIGPEAKAAVPAATKALADPDEDVRYGACYVLGTIGPAAMPAKAELLKRLGGDDEFLAMSAAWALARIHPECPDTPKQSVPVLIKALAEPDAMTRTEAARSLQCLGSLAKDAAAALKKAQGDEDPGVAKAAAEALKAIGG